MDITSFEQDLIGLKKFAERLENFINVEQRYVSESLVISLNASFGSGKTTFLKMWLDRLESDNDKNYKPFVVEVNAWNDDYCGDPLVSLIFAVVESLERNKKNTESIINAAKDIGWFLTGVGNQVVKKITGIDAVAVGEFAEKKSDKRKNNTGSIFEIFKTKKEALKGLKGSIETLIEENDSNILIFVDELDRCRPDYAISYLETIKHVFDIKGIVFVLAVDRSQLECSAKAAFGADLNFPEYYRKFIHREIDLPKPTSKSYNTLASSYVHYYLQRENERNCFLKLEKHRVENIVELISSLKMTPRQVQEVFRILGHCFETNEENKGKLLWCLGVGTILMSALKLGNPDVYRSLGKQELSIKDAVKFIKQLGLMHDEWWFTLIYTGGGLSKQEIESKDLTDIYIEAGLISEGEKLERASHLEEWHSGWGRSYHSRFKQIFSLIEEITSWN